jgi:hypothetical protein
MSIGISTLTSSLELFKILQYDTESKKLFQLVSEIIDSYNDGMLDINCIVNAISSRSPEELSELVQQATIILEQSKKITASLAVA